MGTIWGICSSLGDRSLARRYLATVLACCRRVLHSCCRRQADCVGSFLGADSCATPCADLAAGTLAVTQSACGSRRRLRFFSLSPCGGWQESSAVQTEVCVEDGHVQLRCLCLPYHRTFADAMPAPRPAVCGARSARRTPPPRVLVLGGGGMALPRFLALTRRGVHVHVVEI